MWAGKQKQVWIMWLVHEIPEVSVASQLASA